MEFLLRNRELHVVPDLHLLFAWNECNDLGAFGICV